MALIEQVNIQQGTDNNYAYSNGNTLPLCSWPFGMTNWTLETTDDRLAFFSPQSHTLHGFRATHQPSPWIQDYGAIRILPQTGEFLAARDQRFSAYSPEKMSARPDLLDVFFARYRTRARLTPTMRCSYMLIDFPNACPKRIFFDFLTPKFGVHLDHDGLGFQGYSQHHSGGVPANFAFYFAVRLNTRILHVQDVPDGLAVELPQNTASLGLQVGTSFISADQARLNLEREIGEREFDEVREAATAEWEQRLGTFRVEANPEQKRTFYSCLYRTQLFPRMFHEYDARGSMVHYSPYDGQIHDGPMVADNGFWDTHRTVYPLFSLILKDDYDLMMQGWTNAARECGGWFPRWSSPGCRACMIGTHADAVIADAVVKDRTNFDIPTAYTAMLNHAYKPGHAARLYGRLGIQDYIEQGWLPSDRYNHAVSRTLDYAYNDFCIAQVAAFLGDHKTQQDLLARSRNYRNVYNPETGFMQGRAASGGWVGDFSPLRWGGDYVEGSAWQCSWAVPHDPDGLIDLVGGAKAFISKIKTMIEMEPAYEVGAYNREIHEMSEMALADFGQYAHSNQPVHHVLWLATHAGAHLWASQMIARVVNEMYSANADGFPGDEDNGEMSAWYIFAVMGIFPLCPGKPEYIRTAPLLPEITVNLCSGREWKLYGQTAASHATPEPRPLYWKHQDIMRGTAAP